MKAKKIPVLPTRAYGQSNAEVAFRSNPFSRLMLLGSVAQRREDFERDGEIGSLSATAEEAADIKNALRALSLMGGERYYYRNGSSSEDIADSLDRLMRRHLGPQAEERQAILKAMAAGEKAGHGSRWHFHGRDRNEESNRKLVELVSRIHQALLLELDRILPYRIPDDQLEAELGRGRAYFSEGCGWSQETLDRVEADPGLALAACRLLFKGPTELSLVDQGAYRDPHEMFRSVQYLSNCVSGGHLELNQELPPESALFGFRHDNYQEEEAQAKTRLLARSVGLALRAERWRDQAAEAIKTLTQTRPDSPWEAMPPCGDAMLYSQHASMHSARRAPGFGERGEKARVALGQLYQIVGWRSPLKAAAMAASPGPRLMGALISEARARQDALPEVMGCALATLAKHPALNVEIASAMASRVAEGFAGLPKGAPMEEVFPDLPGVIEQHLKDKELDESSPMRWVGEARWEDPMAPLAQAAMRDLGIQAPDERALVGEAKKALADRAGLTPAAWKALAADPSLVGAFASAVKQLNDTIKPASPKKLGAKRAAMEVMKMADANGSAFLARAAAMADQETRLMPLEALGKTLSACAMGGIGAQEQARLLRAVASSEPLAALLSGRLPARPDGWKNYEIERAVFEGDEADRAGALKQDIDAIVATGPAWARVMSGRLERAFDRAKKEGLKDHDALESAINQLGQLMSDWMDCAAGQPPGFWAGLDKKDPAASAARAHEAWTMRLREERAQTDPNFRLQWGAEAGVMKSGRVEAIELRDGAELFDEGKAMSHCVASYAGRCAQGSSRVFSVRIGGARQTTLELTPVGVSDLDFSSVSSRQRVKRWELSQNRGKHNSMDISQEVSSACQAFARDYSAAFQANTERLAKEQAEAKALAERKKEQEGLARPPRA